MDNQEQLEALGDIRSMMERSSRFISLSGLSGVFAGIFATIGAGAAYWYLGTSSVEPIVDGDHELAELLELNRLSFLIFDAALVLVAAFVTCVILTARKAKKKGLKTWDATAKRTLINLAIPLFTGGVFCLILISRHDSDLVAPCMLIFYGAALLNASKYTLNDIRYLGVLEMALGLLAACFTSYGLLFWTLGFGVLHIVYGTSMYLKYER